MELAADGSGAVRALPPLEVAELYEQLYAAGGWVGGWVRVCCLPAPPLLLRRLNADAALQAFEEGCAARPCATREHQWEAGDIIITDNLAVAHSSGEGAHDATPENGLRVLHRVTLARLFPTAPDWLGLCGAC